MPEQTRLAPAASDVGNVTGLPAIVQVSATRGSLTVTPVAAPLPELATVTV